MQQESWFETFWENQERGENRSVSEKRETNLFVVLAYTEW